MALDWYPFDIVAYRRDTRHLSLEEDACYRRLIDEYMLTREALPSDDDALARIIGLPKTDWHRLAPRVRRFFRMRNDKLWHKRCEKELRAQNARHNRLSKRGRKGGTAKALKDKWLRSLSMLNSSTLQDKEITSTEYVPREGQPRKEVGSAELRSIMGGRTGK